MHDPVKILFEEHEIIVNAIDVAKQASSLIGKNDEQYEKTVRELIYFFRNYADKFHHHKEEEILFPEMIKKNEGLADGVIKEMLHNHEDFRERINKIEKYLDEKDHLKAQQQLEHYTEALLDHIGAENDEVFQIAKTIFDADELQKIYFRFEDCDSNLDKDKKQELVEKIDGIRKGLML